ncbi:hypothetical protein [uncultured Anaeromusa sp.]|uniref:hypothetical protein n=1 Tax=uncultured Anaeromusa sp. TaxID=673273 RepID=UPI0029C85AF5|nr:hypothetical protein [uncultured Anaeromusa sp.]
MAFLFFDLDKRTRDFMLEEYHYDAEKKSIYISPRLNTLGVSQYFSHLEKALSVGTEESFAQSLVNSFNPSEQRKTPSGRYTTYKIPANANQTLAEGEFNRYYIRALCRRALEDGQKILIYRSKPVSNPRAESSKKVGQMLEPSSLLTDLRNNIDHHFGLAIPNSGLSVRLVN